MPGWFDRLFGRVRHDLRAGVPVVEAVAAHNAYSWPSLASLEAQAAAYEGSPWVYVAVNRIAEAAALVPLRVYRLDGERRIPQEAHPAERLLAAPNPFQSGFELLEQTLGALELTGNAYWFLAGDAAGRPAQIWPLRPDRVAVVPDERAHVRGYVYTLDGRDIPLEAVEVIHFRRWHPRSDYYGLSALHAARIAVQSDSAMARWNRDTFSADRAVPAGIVSLTEFVSDADFERIKREWREFYGGPERRTAFLRGGAVQWQSIGLSQQDVDFLAGRRFNREEVFQVFGLPLGLLSENATEANARIAERVFIERTLWPKLVRLAGKLTAELLPFWGPDLLAEFDDIRPQDVALRLSEIRTAYPVLSINELRARYYDLPPVAWGASPVSGSGARSVSADGPLAVSLEDNEALDPGNAEITPALKEATVPSELQFRRQAPSGEAADFPDPAAIRRELKQWERYAIRRLPLKQAGDSPDYAFVVEAVPADLAFEISARLLAAESVEEVRGVFREVGTATQAEP